MKPRNPFRMSTPTLEWLKTAQKNAPPATIYVHTNRLKEVPRDEQLAAEDTPSAVPISQDRLFSSANPSAVQMVGLPSLLCSGWLSIVEFLVLDTREVWEFAEQLPAELWRLCRPRWARRLRPRKPGTSASN